MPRTPQPEWQRTYTGEKDIRRHRTPPQLGGSPLKPPGLGTYAEALWDEIVPQLVGAGVATSVDGPALESMCRWWQTYQECQEQLSSDHSTVSNNRILNASQKAWNEFRRLAESFGLTPKGRTVISTTTPIEEEDDMLGG